MDAEGCDEDSRISATRTHVLRVKSIVAWDTPPLHTHTHTHTRTQKPSLQVGYRRRFIPGEYSPEIQESVWPVVAWPPPHAPHTRVLGYRRGFIRRLLRFRFRLKKRCGPSPPPPFPPPVSTIDPSHSRPAPTGGGQPPAGIGRLGRLPSGSAAARCRPHAGPMPGTRTAGPHEARVATRGVCSPALRGSRRPACGGLVACDGLLFPSARKQGSAGMAACGAPICTALSNGRALAHAH